MLRFLQKEVRRNENFVDENLKDICASVQKTIVDILLNKIQSASKKTGINRVAIAGGVSANSELRDRLLKNRLSSFLAAKLNVVFPVGAMNSIS